MSYIGKVSNSRVGWAIKPVTKVRDSKKKYDRKDIKNETRRVVNDK